jgi:Predicted acyl esterases
MAAHWGDPFGSDTAKYFREHILRPFLAQYLKDGAPKANLAPVTAFQTGTDQWQRLDRWPLSCNGGCPDKSRPLYLEPGMQLGFDAPTGGAAYDEYVPIRRTRCRSARDRSSRSATTTASPGRSGWSMTSVRPPAAPTCSAMFPTC